MEDYNNKEAYKKHNIPHSIIINGYELTYKDPPLKGELFRYRCRTKNCNYFIKMDRNNIQKLKKKRK